MSNSQSAIRGHRDLSRFLPLLVIAGLAINLRPAITATGPLMEEIRAATSLSLQGASLLTVLPMLCMGVFPLLLPWLGQRVKEGNWIMFGLVAIAASSLCRLIVSSGSALIASALLAGAGIAIIQALTPGLVKRWYPFRVPLVMGIYSAFLMAGGGVAAIASPFFAENFNSWRIGLGVWIVPTFLAIIMWNLRPKEKYIAVNGYVSTNFFMLPRAWLLAGYFGLVNGGYACMIAWLPSYARSLGWSAQGSGELIAIMTVFQVIAALFIPMLSASQLDRRPWLVCAIVVQLAGFIGLLQGQADMLIVWIAMIGFGLGACFSLTLTLSLDHLSEARLAGALTAFVQGVGFIITAIIPYLAGVLRQMTGSFEAAWLMLAISLIFLLGITLMFAPSGYVKAMRLS